MPTHPLLGLFVQVDRMDLVGSVVDSDVVIVDDMIDTAGTLGKAADVLVANGGAWPVWMDGWMDVGMADACARTSRLKGMNPA